MAFARSALLAAATALLAPLAAQTARPMPPGELRLNDIQAKGTHNSYHQKPRPCAVPQWDYSLAPLGVQLGQQGVRQLELDVHWTPHHGFTVFHVPVVDCRTSCPTLIAALRQLRTWSDAHPRHHALFLFLEPKDEFDRTSIRGHYDQLEAEILSVWPRPRLLTPDDVRGDRATLREAVTEDGWPSLDGSRQKLVLVMLDRGRHRATYEEGRPSLQGRLMFVLSSPDREDAAILKIDDPLHHEAAIRDAVRRGFIVRTRADAGGFEARANSRRRLQAALRSGAQLISTDFPAPVPERPYWVEIPGGAPSRPNPVVAPPGARAGDLERPPR